MLTFSCEGQKKADPPPVAVSQPKEPATNSTKVDPYFEGVEAITSAYGPNNITRNVIQDRQGNYWLATWEGIIQYDGKTFTNYTNKEGLKRYRAFTILEDKAGNIWFGTIGGGIYRYDGKTFTNYTTNQGLVDNRVACITEAENGDIWFGTLDGMSKFNGMFFTNFTTKDGLTNNDVNSIVEDEDGTFWIGTRGEACTYDGKTFTKITDDEGRAFFNTRTVMEDKQGNIWLGGNGGLWRYDGSSFTNYTKKFIGYLYEDRAENIWFGSDIGTGNWALSRYNKADLNNPKATATQLKDDDRMVFGITEDADRNIWFGTLNGVFRYDGERFLDFKVERE